MYLQHLQAQGLPKDPREAIDNFKGGMNLLNEFAEPTQAVGPGSQSFLHAYSIYSIVFIIVAALVLYWRYKK